MLHIVLDMFIFNNRYLFICGVPTLWSEIKYLVIMCRCRCAQSDSLKAEY